MSLFWYPELNDKLENDGKLDKGMLVSSYIRYFLARLQSMFIYEGLPDSMPQKWLENLLLVNGSAVIIPNGDKGLIATRAGIGGEPDVYYIPTECIVTNPYTEEGVNKTYKRDENCVLIVNDTYAQGLLPMLKKYCTMMAENDITLNIAGIMSRASMILSASDDNTRASAERFIQKLFEGKIEIIGESPFLASNADHALTVNQLTKSNDTITNLIEYHQYLKASLYNELGLQSNYNMKRESINAGESQLNEDMLHPLIDNMIKEREDGIKRVNDMFGTNISVKFNSAWEINEREEEAAIEQIEAGSENEENNPDGPGGDSDIDNPGNTSQDVTPEETQEETSETVEVTITEDAAEEIAEKVAEKLEEDNDNDTDN